MNDKSIQDALSLYKLQGDNCVHEINRIRQYKEYTDDIDEQRLASKINSKIEQRLGSSPEDVLMEQEREKKVNHFIDWVIQLAQNTNEREWLVWRDKNLHDIKAKDIAETYNITVDHVYKINKKMLKKIRAALPLYNKQFGDIKEYLKN